MSISVVVTQRRIEAEGIISLELRPASEFPLPAFTAGAHIDVELPDGIVRQYSLWNSPSEDDCYRIAVLRLDDSRGGSRAVHDLVREGDVLRIGAPRNHFPLNEQGSRSLLVAGGIGITPILSMAEQLIAEKAEFNLYYAVRTRKKAAFLERLSAPEFSGRVHLHVSDEAGGRMDFNEIFAYPAAGSHAYVCGSTDFTATALDSARNADWQAEQLHREFFGAKPSDSLVSDTFEIHLARSLRTIVVRKDESVLRALITAGIQVPTSCEQGICGTCITGVLDGEPDHLDYYLSSEEKARNNVFLPCCSRSKSATLTLDL